jgi:small-conductance mechanosensitive channel
MKKTSKPASRTPARKAPATKQSAAKPKAKSAAKPKPRKAQGQAELREIVATIDRLTQAQVRLNENVESVVKMLMELAPMLAKLTATVERLVEATQPTPPPEPPIPERRDSTEGDETLSESIAEATKIQNE